MSETVNSGGYFKGALLLDFTGKEQGFEHPGQFGPQVTEKIRESRARGVIVIDRAIGMRHNRPVVVRDHLNLTGDNPLTGPNHPCGPRFPVVQGIYQTDCPAGADTGVTAGLKQGIKPDGDELTLMRNFGCEFASYNIVPTMLVAAHKGVKVIAIGLPEGMQLEEKQRAEIGELAGVKL